MPERLITHVRHVDLAVPDYDREREFYKGTWGLTVEAEEPGMTFLAAEGSPEQYIVRLRKSAEKRMELWALGARDAAAVDTLAQRLAAGGVTLINEPDKLQTPGGGYGFRFFDADGRAVEISSDVQVRQHRKIEEKESIPVRLSHVVINSPEPEKTLAFYERFLDFNLSDTLFSPHMGEVMWFLRTSDHHHNIAIARAPHVALHHVSFEMRGLDEYMRGTGRLMRAGVEKIWYWAGTWPATTLSATSWTRRATPSSTPPNWRPSTRTAGTRTCTTSPTPRSPTSGAPPTR